MKMFTTGCTKSCRSSTAAVGRDTPVGAADVIIGSSRPTFDGHAAQLIASEPPFNSCDKMGTDGAEKNGRPFQWQPNRRD